MLHCHLLKANRSVDYQDAIRAPQMGDTVDQNTRGIGRVVTECFSQGFQR